jgi:nucleotide-binding universal stress UspA family protein
MTPTGAGEEGSMMLHERRIVAAVEDEGTGESVAMEAAHLALEQDADTVIFVHVLDARPIVSGLYAMSSVPVPVGETEDEEEALLGRAEGVLHAVYAAWGRPAPTTRREITTGDPAVAIAQIVGEYDASDIVLGARRPHALGELFYRDLRAYLTTHSGAHLHVAAPAPPYPREGDRSVGSRLTVGRAEEPRVLAGGGGGGDGEGARAAQGHGEQRERIRRGHGQQQEVIADL